MADKMMRIAGRGEDGTAKAVKTDNNGNALNKIVGSAGVEKTLQNNQSMIINGEILDVSGFSTVAFQISGTFVGRVWFRGSVDGVNYESLPVIGGILTAQTAYITEKGIYYANVAGYKYVMARIDMFTSGNITVFARASVFPTQPAFVKAKRNVEIAKVGSLSVNPASFTLVGSFDISDYPIIYAAMRSTIGHAFRLSFQFKPIVALSLGVILPEQFVITQVSGDPRKVSEWIEVKGTKVDVFVYNDDTVAHVYDVILYGVS